MLAFAVQAEVPLPEYRYLPVDPGTGPEDRDVPFLAWHEDLSADGYVENEFEISGLANTYEYVDDAGESPAVRAVGAGQPYVSRILIRRPADGKAFNGVVYLEILNATARYDGAPMWNLTYPSIIADGAAWVGVTYSDTTATFLRDAWGTTNFPAPPNAQPRDNSRYANISIRTRAHTWDIVNQAAALIKEVGSSTSPMSDFPVSTVIVTGYSQSAAYVQTFANSFYPSYSETDQNGPCNTLIAPDANSCAPVTDGYIVAAGGPVARLLDGAGSHKVGDRRNFALTAGKIIRFTTESDIKSVQVRETLQEAPQLRTYELAGTSHVDFWGNVVGSAISEYQFGISGNGWPCDLPLNPIRTGVPLSAVQHYLALWIKDSRTPPASAFLDFEGSFDDDTAAWIRDSDGNVTGGGRTARIGVPLGAYAGSNPYSGPTPSTGEIFCKSIIGSFDPFDAEELKQRYTNRKTFVVLTWWNVFLSYLDGFLLAVDAKTIMDEAKAFDGLPE